MDDGVSIGTAGLDEYEARMAKLIELMVDLRPFWPLVIPLYVRWISQQFETAGDFFGEPWQELSPDYAAWKTTHYPGKGLLVAEGDLKHAAQSPSREATPNMLTLRIEQYEKTGRVDAFSVKTRRRSRARRELGKTMDPDWFQVGTDRMPARPLLPLSGELPAGPQGEVAEAAEFYVQDAARRLGLL